MVMRIRVTTKANLFEERRRQHLERGYRIEDEQPVPVNGLCWFIAVKVTGDSDAIDEMVDQALNDNDRSNVADWQKQERKSVGF
jgi:hypothetical protein